MGQLIRISISIENQLVKRFDEYIQRHGLPNRSEAIKRLIRERLIEQTWEENAEVAGTITLMYEHQNHHLVHELMEIQHTFNNLIIASQHIHLNHEDCLEIIVVRGIACQLQNLYYQLSQVRGILHSDLTMASVRPPEKSKHHLNANQKGEPYHAHE